MSTLTTKNDANSAMSPAQFESAVAHHASRGLKGIEIIKAMEADIHKPEKERSSNATIDLKNIINRLNTTIKQLKGELLPAKAKQTNINHYKKHTDMSLRKSGRSSAATLYARTFSKETSGSKLTRRQKKHDMLLQFMAASRKQQRPIPPRRPSFLKTILSLFL